MKPVFFLLLFSIFILAFVLDKFNLLDGQRFVIFGWKKPFY